MRFDLVDAVLDQDSDRIVTLKQVTLAEEYLGDHFPGYPILPGVFMLESMVHAARRLLAASGTPRTVLGGVRNVKYGAMVRPGDALEVTVTVHSRHDDGSVTCKGNAVVRRATGEGGETAASGRFTMRPVRSDASA